MDNVKINEVVPGMVLHEDVVDDRGRLLLPKGAHLRREHVQLLKQRGITSLTVTSQPGGKPPDDETLLKGQELLLPLFSCTNMDFAPMQEIFRISVHRTAEQMQQGRKPQVREKNIPPLPDKFEDLFFKGEGTPQDLVSHEIQLTSFPDIYFRIREILNSPVSTAAHMADVVAKDTSLSAKLLRLVNSPFYGFPSRIDTITRAITMVGGEELSTLALGISAIRVFRDVPRELIDMKEFWKHSLAVGTFAKNLSVLCGDFSSERLLVAGILHDVGRLLMLKHLPCASTDAILYSRSNSIPLVEAERDIFGYDHTLIGGMLLREWKLPERLQTIVRYHHEPSSNPESPEAALIHLADILAIALLTADRGSLIVPPLQEKAWDMLGLDTEGLAEVVVRSEADIDSIIALFLSDSPERGEQA